MIIKVTVTKDEYEYYDNSYKCHKVPKREFEFEWKNDEWNEDTEPLEDYLTRKLNKYLPLSEYCSGAKDEISIKIDKKTQTCKLTIWENKVGRNRWEDRVIEREYGSCVYSFKNS